MRVKGKLKDIVSRIIKDGKEYGWAAVVSAVYYVIVHLMNMTFCPLLQITGLPCAGCGLTRAFLFMARGELARALYIQPMAFLILLFLLYCGYFRYIKGSRIRGFQPLFILLVIAVLFFYVIRMLMYFPDRVPYVYQADNTLSHRIPMYGEWIKRLISLLRGFRGR